MNTKREMPDAIKKLVAEQGIDGDQLDIEIDKMSPLQKVEGAIFSMMMEQMGRQPADRLSPAQLVDLFMCAFHVHRLQSILDVVQLLAKDKKTGGVRSTDVPMASIAMMVLTTDVRLSKAIDRLKTLAMMMDLDLDGTGSD